MRKTYDKVQKQILHLLVIKKRPYRALDIAYILDLSRYTVYNKLCTLVEFGNVIKNTDRRSALFVHRDYADKLSAYENIRMTNPKNIEKITRTIHWRRKGITTTELFNLLNRRISRPQMYGVLQILELEGQLGKVFDPMNYAWIYFSLKNKACKRAYEKALYDTPHSKILTFLLLGPKSLQAIGQQCLGLRPKSFTIRSSVLQDLIKEDCIEVYYNKKARKKYVTLKEIPGLVYNLYLLAIAQQLHFQYVRVLGHCFFTLVKYNQHE